ncbi:MAG: aldehyde dehydrogenase family protein [Caldilineaceae bacterium]|nr:aldehyde dehydrogenase family protein [Caldilineaceae bacterium]
MANSSDFREVKDRVFADLGLYEQVSGLYDGQWLAGEGRRRVPVFSPINGERLADVALAGEEDYDRMIERAWVSFEEWSRVPAPKRGEIVRAIGDRLRAYVESLGLLVTLEVGKTPVEGRGEVQEMIDIADFAVGLSRQLYGVTVASERQNHRLYEQWHPHGVVGVITAFNFPCAVWSWNAFIAAVIGNVVVWKPSPDSALTAIATTNIVNEVLDEHGLPPLFFLAVDEAGEIGRRMSSDRSLPLLSFTGSVRTGRDVAAKVGERLGRSILELGGNNAAIVTPDADMEIALRGVAFGALATAAQRCTTTRRLILHESLLDSFLPRLVDAYQNVRVGSPLQPGVLVGPLINRKAVDNYSRAIVRAESTGGQVLVGNSVLELPGAKGGNYVAPTLIDGLAPDSEIVCEETFAPILYVLPYSSLEEAFDIHNCVPQGLSSAIFSNNLREVEAFLSVVGSDCGLANVNTGTAGAEIGGAFGGEKETGGGRESGSDAWKAYARRQTVTVNYGAELPLAQGVTFDVG